MPANIPYPSVKDGDDFSVTPLMANILALLAAIQSFDGSQIQVGSIVEAALAVGLSPLARDSSMFFSFVADGLLPSGYTGFNFTLPNGHAFVNYNSKFSFYSVTGANYTVSTSKDTYYTLKNDGTVDTPIALANNAALPTLATGSQFLIRVVSDGSGIQRIDDMRRLSPVVPSVRNKFSVYRTAAFTFPASALTVVPFDTRTVDNMNSVDITTNKGRFTANRAGWYWFSGMVEVYVSANNVFYAQLNKNGTIAKKGPEAVPTYAGFGHGWSVQGMIFLNVGDYVEMAFNHNEAAGGSNGLMSTGATLSYLEGFLMSEN